MLIISTTTELDSNLINIQTFWIILGTIGLLAILRNIRRRVNLKINNKPFAKKEIKKPLVKHEPDIYRPSGSYYLTITTVIWTEFGLDSCLIPSINSFFIIRTLINEYIEEYKDLEKLYYFIKSDGYASYDINFRLLTCLSVIRHLETIYKYYDPFYISALPKNKDFEY